MRLEVSPAWPNDGTFGAVIYVYPQKAAGDYGSTLPEYLPEEAKQLVLRLRELGSAEGKPHKSTLLPLPEGRRASWLLLVGAGKAEDFSAERARTTAGAAIRALIGNKVTSAVLLLDSALEEKLTQAALGQAVAEGATLAPFDPGQFKTKRGQVADSEQERPLDFEQLMIVASGKDDLEELRAGIKKGEIIAEGQNLARHLSNQPPNLLTPMVLAEEARKLAELGLAVEVLDKARLESEGMRTILAVAQGSVNPPALVTMRYQGAGDAPYLGLIGKGVTFDSGGISIKPSEGMHLMRMDMAGSAAVIGAMSAIARLKPKANILGVIALVENMPGGASYRPGDVITSLSGKTIEILNTDAEGRLILADAITYAQRLGVNRFVDAATLTGACIVALGHVATGVFGGPQEWVDSVLDAAKATGEKMWQLPTFDEYKDQLKSEIADVANVGGRAGGAITAALFIGEFVEEKTGWVHLDIAGTDSNEKTLPWMAKGPAGTPVRTFVELALRAQG